MSNDHRLHFAFINKASREARSNVIVNQCVMIDRIKSGTGTCIYKCSTIHYPGSNCPMLQDEPVITRTPVRSVTTFLVFGEPRKNTIRILRDLQHDSLEDVRFGIVSWKFLWESEPFMGAWQLAWLGPQRQGDRS